MTVEWVGPEENMGTKMEGDYFTSLPLEAYYYLISLESDGSDANIKFLCTDILPETLSINQDTKIIEGYITELDNWYPGFQRSANFSYDTETTAGGNYANYGSGLSESVTVNFTIRAYHDTLYDPENPNPATYADKVFSLTIENDYSSDRDSFIEEYFENQTLTYDGEDLTPTDFIIRLKQDGYYE
jgi:hypothetical protein